MLPNAHTTLKYKLLRLSGYLFIFLILNLVFVLAGREFNIEFLKHPFPYITPVLFMVFAWFSSRLLNRQDLQHERILENMSYNSLLLDNVSDAVISTDEKLMIKSWNDAAEKMYGYSFEEVKGKNIGFLGLNISTENLDKHKESVKQQGFYRDEYIVNDRSGKEITILASIDQIEIGDKITGYVAVHRDITLRKKLEAQLRMFNRDLSRLVEEKAAETKNIFERVSDAFLAVDKEWRYTYANKQLGEMVKKNPASLIGKNIWEVFPDTVGSVTYETFHRAMQEQKYICSTDYYAPLDLWQENHIYPSPNGLSVFIRDVSIRKQAEEELKRSEEKYRLLIEQAGDAIALFDNQNRILDVNESALVLLGYSREELTSLSLNDVLSAVEIKNDPVDFALLEKGESTIKLRKMIRKNGEIVETEVNARKLPDGTYLAMIRDLTERKKAEQDLKQSYEAIRDLVSHLQDIREEERLKMAQEIHDELGQQLTIMKMDVSWLDNKLLEENPEWKEKTQALKNTLDGTVKTVRRLSSELRPSVLDDMGLAVAIEWQAKEIEKRTGIRIRFQGKEEILNLNDQVKINLFRIVQEALTNVVRYAQATNVDIILQLKNENLLLSIKDDGRGFDPVGIAIKKTLGILGMKERVAALGGYLKLESSPGKGTFIQVTIPYQA